MRNTLCVLNAAKREVGWISAPGDVWTKTLARVEVIRGVEIDSIATPFSFDARTRVLTIVTTANPNTAFTNVIRCFHFAIAPTERPARVTNGPIVYWEPALKSVSAFGTELDIVSQSTLAIDSSGTIVFYRTAWWLENYDRYFFENQIVEIFEEQDDVLERTFLGKIETKTWGSGNVQLKVKNLMADLRGGLSLPTLSAAGYEQISEANDDSIVRMIVGRVAGFVPLNVDSKRTDQYPLPGFVEVEQDSDEVLCTENAYSLLSPGDKLLINGIERTVGEILGSNSFKLTESWTEAGFTGIAMITPDTPRRWMNRVWKIASHKLREPVTLTLAGSSVSMIFCESTRDMFAGDILKIGALNARVGEVVNHSILKLATSLPFAPAAGTTVRRYAVQSVRIDNVLLEPTRDYEIDPETAVLTLNQKAEWNAGQVRDGLESATFSSGSRTVSGSGTSFKSWIRPGMIIRAKGQTVFFEVLSVETDESLTLRETATYSGAAEIQYKSECFWDDSTITIDVLGRTIDGTTDGTLLQYPHDVIRALLLDAGVSEDEIGDFESSMTKVSFAIPETSTDKKLPVFREVINRINVSTLGMLYQDRDFRFAYRTLQPRADTDRLRLIESDVLDVSYSSTNKEMHLTTEVTYGFKEYHEPIQGEYRPFTIGESANARYILKTLKKRTINSVLAEELDAKILALRTAFLHDRAMGEIGVRLKSSERPSIGDIIEIEHSNLPRRLGGSSQRILALVQAVSRSITGELEISCVDLGGGFTRACFIASGGPDYGASNADRRMDTGFISDEDGLVDDDEDSLDRYLIW